MSSRSRLQKLQRHINADIDKHDIAMADILGKIDALFWPRTFSMDKWNVHAALFQLRKRYRANGIRWKGLASGRDSASWKTNQRLRDSMEAEKLITVSRGDSGPSVKLKNMESLRASLGLFTRSQSIGIFAQCVLGPELQLDEPDAPRTAWCGETWLFQRTYKELPTRHDWDLCAERVIPLLVDGSLEYKQTTIGHVCYRVADPTPADESAETPYSDDEICEAIKQIAEADHKPPIPTASKQAIRAYYDSFDSAMNENSRLDPEYEIAIPLPATSY